MRKIRKPYFFKERCSWAIPLTQEVVALVDADMVPILGKHNWFARRDRRRWYALRNGSRALHPRPNIMMHRIVAHAPDGLLVDHVDHFPLEERVIDNRRANLRCCTPSQNQMNKRAQRGGSSRFKGVHWDSTSCTWIARISCRGRLIQLGSHATEELAARAYDQAAKKHFGEFCLTNTSLGLLAPNLALTS